MNAFPSKSLSENRKSAIQNRKWAGLFAIVAAFMVCRARAEAQQPLKVHRIGLLMSTSPAVAGPLIDVFQQGLRELGYVEGKNVATERRFAEAKWERLPDLAAELVALKVDVILAAGSNLAVRAASERPARSQFS